MNMQMSHASTPGQRYTRWRSHVDLIGSKVVCDVRNTRDFKQQNLWFTAVLRRKYSAMVLHMVCLKTY